ncbi:MAG: GNAT family N-acetyltransferase [Ilumatobacter sp.]|uniref:GNAT family N-acetyltransferase n=1 Tax=Ilumatobacter sp. TaxID=1967498 RepID=UPI00261AF65F|nr:GNAT family N-acetyltransferase [Ilumatobacter sp.]MDJ0767676.1 GNAT family N-acetyltransferase [Ilumatobacter sp.]
MHCNTLTSTIRRAAAPSDFRQAAALLHDYAEWIRAATGLEPFTEQPGFEAELRRLSAEYGGEGAALYVAFDGDLAVGTIAVRRHADGRAELKRMYVRPVARGRGVADRLIRSVITAAADDGCRELWLESLRGVMDPAIRLYERHGFRATDRGLGSLTVDGIVTMARPLGG